MLTILSPKTELATRSLKFAIKGLKNMNFLPNWESLSHFFQIPRFEFIAFIFHGFGSIPARIFQCFTL
jgi:hypothetical protein